MQVLVSCGEPEGTLAVACETGDTVLALKHLLHSRSIHVGPPHTQVCAAV
jgi:hypothetical protein